MKEGVKKKNGPGMCARAVPLVRVSMVRAQSDRSGSVEVVEEEEAGQRCWSSGNDGAERGDDTSLILYKVRPTRGHISAARAMKNTRGETLLLFSPLAAAFCVELRGFLRPSRPGSGAHLKRSHTQ